MFLWSHHVKGVIHRKTRRVFLAFLLFSHHSCAEEEYIWKDAIVTSSGGIWSGYSPLDNLIHSTTFKDIVHTLDDTTAN